MATIDEYKKIFDYIIEIEKCIHMIDGGRIEEYKTMKDFNKIKKSNLNYSIKILINDTIDWLLDGSPQQQAAVIALLSDENRTFLLSELAKKSKVTKKILKRGKILDDTEFYILKEYSIREESVPEAVFAMLYAYEFRDQQAR